MADNESAGARGYKLYIDAIGSADGITTAVIGAHFALGAVMEDAIESLLPRPQMLRGMSFISKACLLKSIQEDDFWDEAINLALALNDLRNHLAHRNQRDVALRKHGEFLDACVAKWKADGDEGKLRKPDSVTYASGLLCAIISAMAEVKAKKTPGRFRPGVP